MLSFDVLSPLLNDAFGGKTTWMEASTRHPLDAFIETFFHTRSRVEQTLEGITDAQGAFAVPAHPVWSISESVTHLIYSQGFYLNKILEISTSTLPHVVEAARGFGEGSQTGIPADQLRKRLAFATEQITAAIEGTRRNHDPGHTEVNEYFGTCSYRTWILLLLGHEVDHFQQIVAMRRLARAEGVK